MSKVWKGVKKVFKKVVEVAKKVVPIILAVAAVYFTAGAALGWAGAAAGWGGTVGAASTAVFGEGIVASTVAGAVTAAGTGAAIGGVISSASGGSFTEGAQAGAVSGAVLGGLGGAIGYTPPGGPISASDAASVNEIVPNLRPQGGWEGLPDFNAGSSGVAQQAIAGGQQVTAAPPITSPPPVDGAAVMPGTAEYSAAKAMGPPGGSVDTVKKFGDGLKGFSSKVLGDGGWLERNQTLAGGAIQGIGMGLSANAEADGYMEAMQKKQDMISANYAGTDPGRGYRQLAPQGARQDRYDPRSYGSWEYQYDPEQGRIIKIPVGG